MTSSDTRPTPSVADWQLLREMIQKEIASLGEPKEFSHLAGMAAGLGTALGYMDGIEQGLAQLSGHLVQAVERD